MINIKNLVMKAGCAAVLMTYSAHAALASTTTGMPWETAGQKFQNSITGPTAAILSTVVTVGAGWVLATSEGSAWVNKMIKGVAGVSVVLGASALLANIYSMSTGAIFP